MVILLVGGLSSPAEAATPIAGFREETVAAGLNGSLAIDFAPDGRVFYVEKAGRVGVVNPDGSVKRLLDISGHVNQSGDRGLTGLAVDGNFASNGYLYLLYTYDGQGDDRPAPTTARLTRIVVRPDNTVALKRAPETVILGGMSTTTLDPACPAVPNNAQDCIPADGISHVNGTVRVGPDGTLYVGSGDAMHEAMNGADPLRPQNIKSLAGKIMRIDREGRGIAAHPFCPRETNLLLNCTKLFAIGFRNPFRFEIDPSGVVWAGDVGAGRFEEMDRVTPGLNYGWPCYEGPGPSPVFAGTDACKLLYAREGTGSAATAPIFSYQHGEYGAAIIGGPRYLGSAYPAAYRGSIFFGDFVLGRLERLVLDSTGSVTGTQLFASDWHGVDLRVGPEGYLYSVYFDRITRFVPELGSRAPDARLVATPIAGLAPLTVAFDGSGSSDPDGDAISYEWHFGDGSSSTAVAPSHTYIADGRYTARLTVRDPSGRTGTAEQLIVVGDMPPRIEITSPPSGHLYRAGETVQLAARVTDPEDGTLPDSAIRWAVRLQHDQHQHFMAEFTGPSGSFTTLTEHDADSFYEVDVSATDSDGVTTAHRFALNPKTVQLELLSEPAGDVELVWGGVPHPAPYVARTAVGFRTTVVAPVTMRDASGATLVFAGWSDGGASAHDVTVPDRDLRLVARYVADATPPDTTITGGPQTTSNTAYPTFTFVASEGVKGFECKMDVYGWFPCSSPWKSWHLGNKSHTFQVRAIDVAGNVDPTPASRQFIVMATD